MRRRTVVLAGLALTGCSRPADVQEATTVPPPPVSPPPVSLPVASPPPAMTSRTPQLPAPSPWTPPRQAPEKIVADLEAPGVRISLAWWDGGVRSSGSLATTAAWSTMKVPLVLAAIRGSDADKRAAIRHSDNEAADRLWTSLGPTDTERAAVLTQQLRRIGDRRTTVPQTRLMPPWSVFGQTPWTTSDQLRYLMALPGIPGARALLEDMSQLDGQQHWGMVTLPHSVAKGGWGPRADGGYLVRQMGWFRGSQGPVPLAMAVQCGGFEQGTQLLTKVARAL